MFSFPRPLSIYRRLCASDVKTGQVTLITLCSRVSMFVHLHLCNYNVSRVVSVWHINTIRATWSNCKWLSCAFFADTTAWRHIHKHWINTIRKGKACPLCEGVKYLITKRKSLCNVPRRTMKKGIVLNFVHKYNTIIHSLPQSRLKGALFLCKLTFLSTKTTWAILFLKSRLHIIRKRGSLKLEVKAASSKIVWAL